MVKYLVFDIGGTIICKANSESRYQRISKYINISKKEFKNIYYLNNGNLDELTDLLNSFPKKHQINLSELFQKSSNLFLNDDIIGVFKYALSKKLVIATLSNTNINLFTNLKNTEIGKYIDKEFYSFDIGAYKPNLGAFRYIEKYYNGKPDEFVLIGDSYSSDYLGAKNAGWNSILYDDNINEIYSFINNLTKEG